MAAKAITPKSRRMRKWATLKARIRATMPTTAMTAMEPWERMPALSCAMMSIIAPSFDCLPLNRSHLTRKRAGLTAKSTRTVEAGPARWYHQPVASGTRNPKSEARNPKQIPIPQQTMAKTSGRSGVWDFGFSPLVLVSEFGLRISDLNLMARWSLSRCTRRGALSRPPVPTTSQPPAHLCVAGKPHRLASWKALPASARRAGRRGAGRIHCPP